MASQFIYDGHPQKASRVAPLCQYTEIHDTKYNFKSPIEQDENCIFVVESLSNTNKSSNIISIEELEKRIVDYRKSCSTIIFNISNSRKAEYLSLCLYPIESKIIRNMGDYELINTKRLLASRYSLSEKVKGVENLGVLLNKLDTESHKLLDLVKGVCSQAGIKCHCLSIGNLTEAKLANFPLIDMYLILEPEIPPQICATFPILNAFEFLSGIADTFFSSYYGDFLAIKCDAKEHPTSNVNLSSTPRSFYGLVDTPDSNTNIQFGASGWSRQYSYEHQ